MIRAIAEGSVGRVAAAQVIGDMADAVKELVENSLDAGATAITITLTNLGIDQIQVSDNGSGIGMEDMKLIGRKNCTSKIVHDRQVFSAKTFGFRGEALYSLSLLASSISISSRTASQSCGYQLTISSHPESLNSIDSSASPSTINPILCNKLSQVTRNQGTSISISNLLSSFPVRLAEWKRNGQKVFQRCVFLMQTYAIAHPALRIRLIHQAKSGVNCFATIITTTGTGEPLKQYTEAFTSDPKSHLIRIDRVINRETTNATFGNDGSPSTFSKGIARSNAALAMTTYCSAPNYSKGRKSGDRQFVFLRGRPIDCPSLVKKFNEAWRFSAGMASQMNIDRNTLAFPVFIIYLNDITECKESIGIINQMTMHQTNGVGTFSTVPDQGTSYAHPASLLKDQFDSSFKGFDQFKSSGNKVWMADVNLVPNKSKVVIDGEAELIDQIIKSVKEVLCQSKVLSFDQVDSSFQNTQTKSGLVSNAGSNNKASSISKEILKFDSSSDKSSISKDSFSSVSKDSFSSVSKDSFSSVSKDSFSLVRKDSFSSVRKDTLGSLSNDTLASVSTDFSSSVTTDASSSINNDGNYELGNNNLNSESELMHSNSAQKVQSSNNSCCNSFDKKKSSNAFFQNPLSSSIQPPQMNRESIHQNLSLPSTNDGISPSSLLTKEEFVVSIEKSDFGEMKVIGQFNCGFILASIVTRKSVNGYSVPKDTHYNPNSTQSSSLPLSLSSLESGADLANYSPTSKDPSFYDREKRIYIIDQHASDERYRLEMIERNLSFSLQTMVAPARIDTILTPAECIFIREHRDQFLALGFTIKSEAELNNLPSVKSQSIEKEQYTLSPKSTKSSQINCTNESDSHHANLQSCQSNTSSSFSNADSFFSTIFSLPSHSSFEDVDYDMHIMDHPRLFLTTTPSIKGFPNIIIDSSDLVELVNILAEHDEGNVSLGSGTSGNLIGLHCLSKVAPALASRACRSAIMIGDSLSHSQMESVVRNLKSLQRPWICAHGRPTIRLLSVDKF